ncbi:tRNA lysidine(34) synthetase TilS [Stenotrophomonas sp. ZAC14D1_NAIMI4_6]|uniref:tRNA lysidine(34) synthetase TilS n=3 Tax=Stenotrophomonas TaxID=40323 RepID=UPI0009A19667|nr:MULTISPECIES: tRNA lysidine(34) synthetase TilS [Stenotrophomonas maltophilia group]AWH37982.1 tRNA lysidine(34) synthetase TilS [Stenotrophomonas sp. ZAC14D1_NAIMI4_6]AWH42113.1 tRNA lysidine(34) synthetase TilS [Stenotrophomonas sp. ZAC14D1_NAIMI4_1]
MSTFPTLVTLESPLLVAYSGGLDSTVLLHWLQRSALASGTPLRAVHVHHGLQASADDWVQHCQQQCDAMGIALAVHRVQVDTGAGLGLEAAARQARRAAFAAELREGETLALAQHQDDQAETFLLRALRGSGIDGLAAMAEDSLLHGHRLWRPLLHTVRSALRDYAHRHALRWIEDPSNGEDHADRNFLRLHVLPLLRQRWPHAATALAGSAAHCAQTRTLLDEEDAELIAHLEVAPRVLSLELLRQVSPARGARVLRAWVRAHGAAPLPATVLRQLQQELLDAPSDRQAQVRWQDHAIQQWRGHAYLLPALLPALPAGWQAAWDGRAPLPLPDGGQLRLLGCEAFDRPLQVRARQGGERILLPGRTHSHALKDCLQREHLAPWRRAQLPLLFDGGQLLAAADVVVSAPLQAWLLAHDAQLQWRPGGW